MYKPFDLTGKVALITGGNGGIGLAMAEALAMAGANVVIWGTNPEKNDAAEKQLKSHGTRILSRKVDVTSESEIVEGMQAAIADMGRVDCAMANAGMLGPSAPVTEMPLEEFRKVQTLNQEGVFLTLREAAKHMVSRAKKGDAGGSLVGVASVSGFHGAARVLPYGTSKGAVLSMVRAMAVELARFGVRANTIVPGWTATDMSADARKEQAYVDKVLSRVPMRRWGNPEDFGGIAVYLASNASKFHTGDTFVIDGGYMVF